MDIDPDNPVVALCAAGMAVEGDADAAHRLFEQAWDARTDDYDASIAAHFLARHQSSDSARLHWNTVAVQHAELVADDRAREFLASLYLNLADSFHACGDDHSAGCAIATARRHLADLPDGGYRSLVEMGVGRLEQKLAGVVRETVR